MAKKYQHIYQFKITLKDIKPPIWRRIQVPETYTFWDLHIAIQDAMGWEDYHLHQFDIIDGLTGIKVTFAIPDDEYEFTDELPSWEHKIAKQLIPNKTINYTYDFGDCWEHAVKLEKILPRQADTDYPTCTAGRRACPPEDCGGVWGYVDFLDVINDPSDEEHDAMIEWIGGKFDPEDFNPRSVVFDDPLERLNLLFDCESQ